MFGAPCGAGRLRSNGPTRRAVVPGWQHGTGRQFRRSRPRCSPSSADGWLPWLWKRIWTQHWAKRRLRSNAAAPIRVAAVLLRRALLLSVLLFGFERLLGPEHGVSTP